MTRGNRMALACLTQPGHAGMEQLSLADGDWLPWSWRVELGMDLQTLYAATYCGLWHPPVAVVSPVLCPAGLWDAAAAALVWCLCWLVPVDLGTPCIYGIWPCTTQLMGPDHYKKLSQCVCVVGLSQEQSSWVL